MIAREIDILVGRLYQALTNQIGVSQNGAGRSQRHGREAREGELSGESESNALQF